MQIINTIQYNVISCKWESKKQSAREATWIMSEAGKIIKDKSKSYRNVKGWVRENSIEKMATLVDSLQAELLLHLQLFINSNYEKIQFRQCNKTHLSSEWNLQFWRTNVFLYTDNFSNIKDKIYEHYDRMIITIFFNTMLHGCSPTILLTTPWHVL